MAKAKTLSQRIEDLIEGKAGAAAAVADLLRRAPLEAWLAAARHAEPAVRAAAVAGATKRFEPEVVATLNELLSDGSSVVVAALVTAITDRTSIDLDSTQLLEFLERIDDDGAPIVRKLPATDAYLPRLIKLVEDDDYPLEEAAATALKAAVPVSAIVDLVRILCARTYADVRVLGLIEHYLTNEPTCLDFASLAPEQRRGIRSKCDERKPQFSILRQRLDEHPDNDTDEELLVQYGRLLSKEAAAGDLPQTFLVDDSVDRVLARVNAESGSRCVLITGAAGTGKTALIHAAVHRLAADGWTVLEAVPAELMVGTKWLGEWETRVQKLLAAAKSPRKVVLVMPNVHDLLQVGRSSSRDTSASSLFAPLMERGEVVVIGEADRDAFIKGTGATPTFRRLFAQFEMVPATVDATRQLVGLVSNTRGVEFPPELVEQFLHLAEGFVTNTEQPGRTLGLVRRVLDAIPGEPTVRDVLEILSESTGAPVDFLDHNVALDLNETRRFFESRVVGQPEAIDAVLDTVTLIKAGLTDPQRPNGVLLFVGPTGVGKTELARALAKFLFEDEARLHRFDMSEFASYESYERLIGSKAGTGGLLTDAIQSQPFSIVLLDEIEKAHANVFDLLLQVFDAGRLTDGRGRTVDFRNAVVILTSNVGSRVATRAGAGFTGAVDQPSTEMIQRALEQQFRPEFLGRLDRIVTFRPLDSESAERIVRREIAAVLRRNGITTRRIAVDVDPDVVGLLLKVGYSPAYGARPLKRAIETQFLLPLARLIAAGRVLRGSVLGASVVDGAIALRLVDAPKKERSGDEPIPATRTRSLAELQLLMTDLEPLADDLAKEKSELLVRQGESGFWSDTSSAVSVLDRIHRLDRLISDSGRLTRDIERTERNRDPRQQANYLAAHLREFDRLQRVLTSKDLRDCAIVLERLGTDANLDSVGLLLRMYQGFGARQRLETDVVDDMHTDEIDRAALVVAGSGAYELLRFESGLHRIRSSGERRVTENVSVRVIPLDTVVGEHLTKVELVSEKGRMGSKKRMRATVSSADSRVGSLQLVAPVSFDRDREELVQIASALLEGRAGLAVEATSTVRRYDLGASPLVTDLRTGTRSGRLGDVLAGNFDVFSPSSK
jgi:ATP-dependent Clp protease ATP-binding subunit ClpC